MFEMMVRRFTEKINAAEHHHLSPISRWPSRRDYIDGRECRNCRAFFPHAR